MIFEYQALNKQGDKVSDLIDASSEISARQKLRSKDLYVVKISQHDSVIHKEAGTGKGALLDIYNKLIHDITLKLSTKQVGIFSRQLATLLHAGMPLLTAVTDIIDQIENKNFKRIIVDIKEKLVEGMSFSNCLGRHKIIFSDMYVNMVRVGENLGSLDHVIERLADIEEKKNDLKGKIQAALYYPAFLMFFSVCVVSFLMVSIVPSLARMFEEMGKDLPLPTKIIMGLSGLLSSIYFLVPFFGIISAAVYYFYKYIKTPEGKLKLDQWKLQLPLIKNIYKKLIVLRFTQNLGILLNNRVDILRSFEIVKQIVGNVIIEKEIAEVSKKVSEGSPVSKALAKSEFLPKLVLGMIAAGEASDQLDTMLIRIGEVYEKEVDMNVAGFAALIEPMIIVFMGLVIGGIIVSVLLPIFEMNLMV
jgi:general secretion pathway protein F